MARTFSLELKSREPRVVGWIRSGLIAVAVVYGVLATWGMYRRIWQVQRIELSVPSTTLSAGSTISYDVITSGEVQNLIRLELVQGGRSVVLAEKRGGLSAVNTIDPRLFRTRETVLISSRLLASLEAGTATVRLTVFGGQKLLRTPAPRMREYDVRVARFRRKPSGRGTLRDYPTTTPSRPGRRTRTTTHASTLEGEASPCESHEHALVAVTAESSRVVGPMNVDERVGTAHLSH